MHSTLPTAPASTRFTALDLTCACVTHGRERTWAARNCVTCEGSGTTVGVCAICDAVFGEDADLAYDDTLRGFTVEGERCRTELCSVACAAAWWAMEIDGNGTQLSAAQEAA